MDCIVVVKVALSRPYADWVADFDADAPNREAGGVHCLFRAPVIGEQAVVFTMRTANPRSVHDMMYHPEFRPMVEASGLVVGSEQIILCEGGV